MGVGATPQPERGKSKTRLRVLLAVRRFLDWLVTPEVALDILVGAASTVVLGFLLDAGKTALWLGAFLSPLFVRSVRGVARDWRRSKKLAGAALLVLVDGVRSGRLSELASRVGDGLRHLLATQVAPAAAASAVTVAGFTVTEAALGRPTLFFGDESTTVEVLGFTLADWAPGRDLPALVASGGSLRACDASTFTALLHGENGEEGTRWSRRWVVGGEIFAERPGVWPAESTFTNGWGPFYTRGNRPTGEPLPGGRWVLTVLVEGDPVAEASVRLVNDAC